ncbi:hypothetical protein [Longimicrobium terrae]|uniref:Uncharacterized protein n=1 Tax=Longimicrobium terrae TaxID=1639882 RepID=A0A841H2Q6_9BACT|nr:hypothetical protein [Longimicrobium terrae]MBB4638073.1 hypothetical protein [Longimicrobium terrae]MBB6072445.1 hypothetical protein [Longimicrobium terrae]NNC32141.1 hypothetical protein [Longimicrobium terrae]
MKHIRILAALAVAAGATAACDTPSAPVASRDLIKASGITLQAVKLSGSQSCASAADTIFLADNDTISGQVNIPNGCTLRVRPADNNGDGRVTIYGDASVAPSALVVHQGARIYAEGSATVPIVFTPTGGSTTPGAWGGIVLIGNAPTNDATATVEGIPGSVAYGGSVANDNSGTLRYVRIEYAGYQLVTNNELNGLSLYGVGSGTTLEYIQVHRGSDDGIEFFGGTASIRYAVVTGAEDDSFDYSFGWVGNAQFVIVQQGAAVGDKGIEADNDDAGSTGSPVTDADIWNITLVGRDASVADSTSVDAGNIGIQLRRNVASRVRNAIVLGFDAAFDGTGSNATITTDSVTNSIFYAKAGYTVGNSAVNNIEQADPQLVNPWARSTSRDFRPTATSRSRSGGYTGSKTGLVTTTFRGAVPQTTSSGVSPTWYTGWTTWAY